MEKDTRSVAERLKQDHGIKLPETITDRCLSRSARPASFSYNVYDKKETGLGVTISPAGRRTWFLQAKFPGQASQARRALGTYPDLKLGDARLKAAAWRALIKKNIDPADKEREEAEAAAKERRSKAERDASKFAAAVRRYSDEVLVRQRRGKAVTRELDYLAREWGDRPIASITPQDIKTVIGRLAQRVPFQARNVFGGLSVLLRWCVHEDLLVTSPMASLSKKLIFAGVNVGPRQRCLDDDELKAFWIATGQLGHPMGSLYRLLLLTGCRLTEISQARFRELHPELRRALRNGTPVAAEHAVLTIPAARFKSGVEHSVQLSDDAVAILASLPREALARSGSADFIFSRTAGRLPVAGHSKSKSQLDQLMTVVLQALARSRGDDPATVALRPFVIHDLRRSVRSGLSALNVDDHVAEMCLGHGRKGLQRVYDQHKYGPQIRTALEAWAQRLRGIVEPQPSQPTTADNVVSMKGKKRA
jgi:integrase